jgi:type IV pilus assembly protein PilO
MKISKREMILIGILLLVSTFYLVNKYVINSFNGELKALQTQKDNLTAQLQKINEIKSTTSSEKDTLEKQVDEINDSTKKLFPELKYDKITVILNQMFTASNLLCESMTFSDVTSVNLQEPAAQTSESKENDINKLVDDYFKVVGSNNESNSEKKETTAINTSKAEISKLSVTLSFRGKYSELTNFIKALEDYEKFMIINNITIASSEKGQVGGVLNLDLYAIPKPFEDSYFKHNYSKPSGIGNPFTGEGTAASSTEVSQSNHFLLTAKPSSSDLPAFSLIKVGNEKSAITSNGNGVENVEITFTEEQGKIYYKYKNGTKTYPSNYSGKGEVLVVDGDSIIITANSIIRNSNQDLSGVSLTINNNTKKIVKLMIINDDAKRPRILLASKKGEVIENRK